MVQKQINLSEHNKISKTLVGKNGVVVKKSMREIETELWVKSQECKEPVRDTDDFDEGDEWKSMVLPMKYPDLVSELMHIDDKAREAAKTGFVTGLATGVFSTVVIMSQYGSSVVDWFIGAGASLVTGATIAFVDATRTKKNGLEKLLRKYE